MTDALNDGITQALTELPDGNVLVFEQAGCELAVCTHATFRAMQDELTTLRIIRDKLMAPTSALLN